MSVIKAKCTNCGEIIDVDNNKEADICPYCKEAFVVERAINNYLGQNYNAKRSINNNSDFEINGGALRKYIGSLTQVEIPNNVTVIGAEAFANTAITYVYIPSNVIEIKFGAFKGCKYLKKVIIDEGLQILGSEEDTGYHRKGSVFFECSNLESINLPESLIELGPSCFIECRKLKIIKIPSKVKFSSDFINCEALEKIQLPDNLEKLGSFQGCINLKRINIPSTVKEISHGAFINCKSLKRLQIPEGITPSMPICRGCENLESVKIPSTIKFITELTFGDCKKLDNVIIPANVRIQGVADDPDYRSAFEGCIGMHTITLKENVYLEGWRVFASCLNLEEIRGVSAQWLRENTYHLPPNLAAKYTNNGCYIATCVYGTYNCPEVWTLRRFRDFNLKKNTFGRIFVKSYYKISPFIVKKLGKFHWCKMIWKFILDKIVETLNKQGITNTPYYDRD